jgi:hypothetical protein
MLFDGPLEIHPALESNNPAFLNMRGVIALASMLMPEKHLTRITMAEKKFISVRRSHLCEGLLSPPDVTLPILTDGQLTRINIDGDAGDHQRLPGRQKNGSLNDVFRSGHIF